MSIGASVHAARSLLVAALMSVLLFAASSPARAQGECPLEDLSSGLWPFLSNYSQVWEGDDIPGEVADLFFDPSGDTVSRTGSPADGADVLCALPFLVSAGDESVYGALDLATLTGDDDVVVIAPAQPSGPLLNDSVLNFLAVGTGTLPDPLGMQLGFGFGGGPSPDYTNPSFIELDGAHTWPGVFFDDDRFNLDLTQYRNGSFTQGPTDDLIVVVGPDWALYVFPGAVGGDAETWRSYTVSQNVVDVIDLAAWNPEALPRISLTQAGATPNASQSPSASPAVATPPASTADGGPPLLPLVGAGLLAAAVLGGVLFLRRSSTTSTLSASEMAAQMIAADVASTPLVGRTWKSTRRG